MRIAYFYNEEWEKEFMASRLPDDSFIFYKESTARHPEVFDSDAEVLSVFGDSKIDSE